MDSPGGAGPLSPEPHEEAEHIDESVRRRGRHRRRSSEDSSNTWGGESAVSGQSGFSQRSRISVHSDEEGDEKDGPGEFDEERQNRLSDLGSLGQGGSPGSLRKAGASETDVLLEEMKRKALDMQKKERKATRVRKASQGVIRVDQIPFFTSYMKERRHEIGLPTAMCVRGKLVAIATSQGVVNVFNTKTEGE